MNIDSNSLKNRKLFVATPLYGGQCYGQYMNSMMALKSLCKAEGIAMKWEALSNESLITRARNLLADSFLQGDYTHFMFIDADIEFEPQDVLTLLEMDKDVVTGAYPRKRISWPKVALAVEKGFHREDPNLLEHFAGEMTFSPIKGSAIHLQEPVEVLESGCGFMMIKRSVFTQFAEAHPELSYIPDHKTTDRRMTAFFMDPLDHQGEYYKGYSELKEKILSGDFKNLKEIIDKTESAINTSERRHLSEDYYFCHEVRKLGMKVWLCPWMMLNHIGTHKFLGDMQALAELA